MIPKIIHYCWFGGKEKPSSFDYCLATWKMYLPDYEIKEWNESNFIISESVEFVKEAYSQKKWAFVSDYVRVYALLLEGGIYMDTDVEIKNNLDEFLVNDFFIGLEKKGYVSTALIGSTKKHPLLLEIINYYNKHKFEIKTNNSIISSILEKSFGFNKNIEKKQIVDHNINIYPYSYFTLDLNKNFATHHFTNTWQENVENNKYKNSLHIEYYLTELNKVPGNKKEINNMINNQNLFEESYILDLVPTKNIIRYLKRKIINKILGH